MNVKPWGTISLTKKVVGVTPLFQERVAAGVYRAVVSNEFLNVAREFELRIYPNQITTVSLDMVNK